VDSWQDFFANALMPLQGPKQACVMLAALLRQPHKVTQHTLNLCLCAYVGGGGVKQHDCWLLLAPQTGDALWNIQSLIGRMYLGVLCCSCKAQGKKRGKLLSSRSHQAHPRYVHMMGQGRGARQCWQDYAGCWVQLPVQTTRQTF
jgi:hypothetical protein